MHALVATYHLALHDTHTHTHTRVRVFGTTMSSVASTFSSGVFRIKELVRTKQIVRTKHPSFTTLVAMHRDLSRLAIHFNRPTLIGFQTPHLVSDIMLCLVRAGHTAHITRASNTEATFVVNGTEVLVHTTTDGTQASVNACGKVVGLSPLRTIKVITHMTDDSGRTIPVHDVLTMAWVDGHAMTTTAALFDAMRDTYGVTLVKCVRTKVSAMNADVFRSAIEVALESPAKSTTK